MKDTEFNYHGRKLWVVAGWVVWLLLIPLWLVGMLGMVRYEHQADAMEQQVQDLLSESNSKAVSENVR